MNQPSDFHYLVMHGKSDQALNQSDLYAQVFGFWQTFWNKVYADVGTDQQAVADDFLRQSYVAALMHGDEIVAAHTYTLFDLACSVSRQHSYFSRYYPPEFFTALSKANVRHVMTMEYLAVDPAWRKSRVGVSLAEVVIGLGVQIAQARGLDGIITAARADVPAADLARKLGAKTIVGDISIHGCPTDLVAWNQPFPPLKGLSAQWIDFLWAEKDDYTRTLDSKRRAVAAA